MFFFAQDTAISELNMVCGEKLKATLSLHFGLEWHQITYGKVGELTDQTIDQLNATRSVKERIRSLRKVVRCFMPDADRLDKIRFELTCPISLEVVRDPVVIPCCGKVFERGEAFKLHFERRYGEPILCPCCRGQVHFSWPNNEPRRNILANISSLLTE